MHDASRLSTGLMAALLTALMMIAFASAAKAQETPTIGGMLLVAGSQCPHNFAEADGRLQSIRQQPTLFGLIGTTYGGDGEDTFALPDMRGRAPVGRSDTLALGQGVGQETVTLSSATLPSHGHAITASDRVGTLTSPAGADLAEFPDGTNVYSTGTPGSIVLEEDAIGQTGEGEPL